MVALWEFALVCAPLALLSGVATGAAASSAWLVLVPVLLNGFELDVFESLFIAASVDMMSSSVVAAVHAWHRKTHVAVALAFGLPAAFFAAFMFYFVPRAGSFMTSSLEEVILGSVTIVIGSAIIIFAVIERNELEDQDLEHQQDGSGGTAAAGAAAGAAGGAVGVDGKPSASERYLINPGMPRRWVHTTLEQPDHMFTSEIPIFGVDPTHTKRPVLLATACCLVIFAGEALGMLSGILCIGCGTVFAVLFSLAFNFELRLALGTSLVIQALLGLSVSSVMIGTVSTLQSAFVSEVLPRLAITAVPSIIGAVIGLTFVTKLRKAVVLYFIGALVAMVGVFGVVQSLVYYVE